MQAQQVAEAEGGKIITAKLVRGKVYSYFEQSTGHYLTFKRNVPVEVSAKVANELEDLVDEINTDEGEVIEKNRFEIDYEAERRTEEDTGPRRLRMRIVPVDDRPKRVVGDATVKKPIPALRPRPRPAS